MRAQYGIMLFFAAWCLIMTVYVILCLPETKGVPIEEIVVVWRKHWLWKRFVEPAAIDVNGGGDASRGLVDCLLLIIAMGVTIDRVFTLLLLMDHVLSVLLQSGGAILSSGG